MRRRLRSFQAGDDDTQCPLRTASNPPLIDEWKKLRHAVRVHQEPPPCAGRVKLKNAALQPIVDRLPRLSEKLRSGGHCQRVRRVEQEFTVVIQGSGHIGIVISDLVGCSGQVARYEEGCRREHDYILTKAWPNIK